MDAPSDLQKELPPTGLFKLVDPKHADLDIVFIHGFTGHPEKTWTWKQGASTPSTDRASTQRPSKRQKLSHSREDTAPPVFWPQDILPSTAPNARIFTFGYETHISHAFCKTPSKSSVYDIAWDFLVRLDAKRQAERSRPLLFIVHSLGGVLIKEALRQSRDCESHQSDFHNIYHSTQAIIFFGTPHGGADPRELLHHVAESVVRVVRCPVNQQVVDMLLPTSAQLQELRHDFGLMARQKNWIIFSFQEQYGTKVLGGRKVTFNDFIDATPFDSF